MFRVACFSLVDSTNRNAHTHVQCVCCVCVVCVVCVLCDWLSVCVYYVCVPIRVCCVVCVVLWLSVRTCVYVCMSPF